ncbi:MAG: septum formation initiator family protein [Bradymonadales bacterium]|jgi:cell division protein FtsB
MENVIKWFLGFSFIVVVTLLAYQIYDLAHAEDLVRLKQDLAEVEEGNAELRKQNELLQIRIVSLRSDPRSIERKVRDELGLVRQNEVIMLLNQ